MTRVPVTHVRSALFTPGNSPRKLANALVSAADLVIADLEDSVPLAERAMAREAIIAAFRPADRLPLKAVRISGDDVADLAACAEAGVDAVVVPKATPARLAEFDTRWPLIAIVETAEGLLSARDVAATPNVELLLLGSLDLGAELALEPRLDGAELLYARSHLVVASAAAAKAPPLDGVYREIADADGLAREVALARSLGFGGKACIHPAQLEIVNDGFSPSAADVEWARRVIGEYLGAAEAGRGAIVVDGAMVDVPVVDRARRLLARHEAVTGLG